jgi:hypothetical protein
MAQIIKADPANFDEEWDKWIAYAYSNEIDKEAPKGIGDREEQYTTEVKNSLKEWYPNSFTKWENSQFNWFTQILE